MHALGGSKPMRIPSMVDAGIDFLQFRQTLYAPLKYLPFTTIIISNYGLFADNLRLWKPIDLTVLLLLAGLCCVSLGWFYNCAASIRINLVTFSCR